MALREVLIEAPLALERAGHDTIWRNCAVLDQVVRANAKRAGERVRQVEGEAFREKARRIQRNCRRAMNPGGRVAVIELLLGEVGEPGQAPLRNHGGHQ